MTIPQSLLPYGMSSLKQFSSATQSLQETKATVAALLGNYLIAATSSSSSGLDGKEEVKLVKYLGLPADSSKGEVLTGKIVCHFSSKLLFLFIAKY